ncbi:MAG: DUF192 domain-containing protein [Nanoarchaeota archaeon]|nr:DUF192 domain-containing protein [Nanoarchaeota archaeon]
MNNINKREIIVIIVLFLLVLGFSFYYNYGSVFREMNSVCFEERCFTVEIADDDEERQQGLMFRESLEQDKGMFFVFPKNDIYPFWMKNTLIPLDIIWIDENRIVVFISKNVQPCVADPCQIIEPEKEALYVLELNAGTSDEIGLEVGDEVEFRNV